LEKLSCEEVKVKVIGIDESNRINLSIKKVTEPPARPAGGQGQGQGQGRPRQQGGFAPRQQGGYAPRQGGAPRQQSGYAPRPAASKEPLDFEDRLKQFMQSSDSKLSELRYLEKKGNNRRGGGGRRG
jgi:S1 RNA binding domain protein